VSVVLASRRTAFIETSTGLVAPSYALHGPRPSPGSSSPSHHQACSPAESGYL